jgi:hypothetical protein
MTGRTCSFIFNSARGSRDYGVMGRTITGVDGRAEGTSPAALRIRKNDFHATPDSTSFPTCSPPAVMAGRLGLTRNGNAFALARRARGTPGSVRFVRPLLGTPARPYRSRSPGRRSLPLPVDPVRQGEALRTGRLSGIRTPRPLCKVADVPGWGPWSINGGRPCIAHAPAEALSRDRRAPRSNLDEPTAENGPLKVLPGTHHVWAVTHGRADQGQLAGEESKNSVACLSRAGGVVVMRPAAGALVLEGVGHRRGQGGASHRIRGRRGSWVLGSTADSQTSSEQLRPDRVASS